MNGIDIEAQKQTPEQPMAPLFRHSYNRNRCLFAMIDVALLLLNSFWAHRQIAITIIAVPSVDIFSLPGQFQNSTKDFSNSFVAQLDADNAVIRKDINETLARETSRVEDLLSNNTEKLRARLREERTIRSEYNNKALYLQSWSRVGNTVPYQATVTQEDQLTLETALSLENGAIIQELAGDSISLTEQLRARYDYDVEYLRSKTVGLIPSLIPNITASLQLPGLDADIRARVLITYKQLAAQLQPVRDYIAYYYESINLQLPETELAFSEISVKYELLIKTVRQFYEILDNINIVGFSGGIFPRIDIRIKAFPHPASFLPDAIGFPGIIDFMKPFDDVLLRLENPFDKLAVDIFELVDLTLDAKVGEVVAALIAALSPDDYFPPTIDYQGNDMSPSDALLLNGEITANLTTQANLLPNPTIFVEEPSIKIPEIVFKAKDFEFARGVVDLFAWSMPNLDIYVSLLREIFLFLWGYYVMVEVFFINIYRALRKVYEYFEGTAVPLPAIDLRTKAEKEDVKKRKRSKCNTALGYVFHPLIGKLVTQLIPLMILSAFIFAGCNYYVYEFHPNCVLSSTGTSIGNFAVGPFLYNQALAAGQEHAINLSLMNHVHIQEQCQLRSFSTYDAYQQQVVGYEESRFKSVRDLKGLQKIRELVDMDMLCEQHERACSGADPQLNCPILEDGSIVGNPCDSVSSDTQIINEVLEVVEFNCDSVPQGELTLDGMRERVQQELEVEENWCVVEWWFLGHLGRVVFVLVGYIALYQSFRWIIDGLQTFYWHLLRPEWWKIQCTADRNGNFTQPEYSDPEAKAKCIREWEFVNRCLGASKLLLGISIFAAWVFIALATWHLQMVPSWYAGS